MNRFLLLVAVLATHIGAWAHKPSDSYLTMTANGEKAEIAVRWDIALRDLDYVLGLDRDGNGDLTWGEVRTRGDDIAKYAIDHLQVTGGEKACALESTAP